MSAQLATVLILVAAFCGFILGAVMGDVFDWWYRRRFARDYQETYEKEIERPRIVR